MDITAILRANRGRVRFGTASKTGGNAREFGHKAYPGAMMGHPGSHRPVIVSAYGIDQAVAQSRVQLAFPAILRCDRFRVVFRKSSKNPGNSSKRLGGRKKFADRTPSRGEKPGETQVPGGQTRQNVQQRRPKTVANEAMFGGRDRSLNPNRLPPTLPAIPRGSHVTPRRAA